MRVLELFSGTGSVGKICKEKGYEVVSLDLKNADINTNIMEWNYRDISNNFDIIWASPPCDTFSKMADCCYTKEEVINRINTIGLPILRKTEEIIDYFNPRYYFIENPQTGKMKNYITNRPYYDVDYCQYSDFGYKKRTRIWTNKVNFNNLLCNGDCDSMIQIGDSKIHRSNCGSNKYRKLLFSQGINIKNQSKEDRYRIPSDLIRSLFEDLP
jgi:hypothetical protein